MTAITTNLEPRTSTGFSLKLPREHGAVVTFALATFLSICLARASFPFLFQLTLIWLLFLSLHNSKQLFLLAALETILMLSSGFAPACLLPVLLISCAPSSMRWLRKNAQATLLETLGMLGVSVTPFLLDATAGYFQTETLTVAACFCASTLIATSLVRAARKEMQVKPTLPLLISLCLWLPGTLLAPKLIVVCLAPFVVQAIWLTQNSRPSFKAMGITSTICMLVVTVSLAFWLSAN